MAILSAHKRNVYGFTIIELLIVIVIIAILAAIAIVAFGGIQERARNTERESEIAAIEKTLEMYYINHGSYPSSWECGSSVISDEYCTTADASWDELTRRVNSIWI